MPYDGLTTLRGLQAVSEMQGAGVDRRRRLLQLAQEQKQFDDQQKIDAAAKASVTQVPQRTFTPPASSINVGGVDLSSQPSEVSNPAHSEFDRAGFAQRLTGIDPLAGQDYEANQAAIQQKSQDDQVARQQKLVQLQNGLADLDSKDRAAGDAKRKQIKEATGKAASLAWAIKNAPPEQKPQVYQYVRNAAMQDPQLAQQVQGMPEQYTPEIEPQLDQIIASGLEVDKLIDNSRQQSAAVETVRHNKAMEAKRPADTAYPGGAKQNDAKDIAAAIISGEQPPTLTGLYRNAAPVRAELARQHFNLAQAESDWKAVQKHLSTLNGAQQERLRQAVQFTTDSTDIIESLYNEWQKVGATSGWKIFNKGSLATAKQLPGRAGEVAQALEAQINDLTSELGTVYKGGNSSTDESLRLAAGNLKADWNEQTFKRGLSLIRQNLKIRKNSIDHSQAAGVSADSPYAPKSQAAPPAGGFDWNAHPEVPK